jgi:hypothetical protein
MAYSWIVERMAEEHRRDLAVARMEHRKARPGELTIGASLHTVERNPHVQPQLQAKPQHKPYAPKGAGRHHFTHQVGTLLIRAGTRLGDASMRTS